APRQRLGDAAHEHARDAAAAMAADDHELRLELVDGVEQPEHDVVAAHVRSRRHAGRLGAVYVDGRRVHPVSGNGLVLATLSWRDGGAAAAGLGRLSGETRLVVLPTLSSAAEPLAWPLPRALGGERIHWAGERRVVVGPAPLEPRAVASWTDG